ncbi:MAG: radical SAM protein [Syntrophobacterales bacterium]|nr:radical SAM protein [Syntrophobacterales bacterium]
MLTLTLEPTNACNRRCRHCCVNPADPPCFLPVELAASLLEQARTLGVGEVFLTGGEVSLYPDLKELLDLLAGAGFSFTLVTNGWRFRERLLPALLRPEIRERLKGVCFSLDGARAGTHDALRGEGSFAEVVEAVGLCVLTGLPRALKSVITRLNQGELTELALLGAMWGVQDHSFILPQPTPRLLREGLLPEPEELLQVAAWVRLSLARTVRGDIRVEGWLEPEASLVPCPAFTNLAVDSCGRQVLCCNYLHLAERENHPSHLGREYVAHLMQVTLREGLRRQYQLLGELMEARLAGETPTGLQRCLCYWCLTCFGKLAWLQDFSHSAWGGGPERGMSPAGGWARPEVREEAGPAPGGRGREI